MKRIFNLLCCCLLTVFSFGLSAQDGGPDCATATDITANITATCNTITNTAAFPTAGTSLEDPCLLGSAPTESLWYSFVAPASGLVDISSTNDAATPDTQLSFHDAAPGCGALVCDASDDDGGAGFTSQLVGLPVTAGNTYYIQWLDGWTAAPAAWELQFAADPAASLTGTPTQTDATLAYDAACPTMTYEFGPTGFAQGTGTSGTTTGGSETLTGLTPATTYDICFFCDALGSGETAANAITCDWTSSDAGAGSESPSVQCVTFTTSANCPTPTATAAAGATDDVVDVTLTSNGGGGLFDVEIGAPGFVPGTATEIAQSYGVFGPVESFTGLACSSTFEVYVRDNCPGPPAEVSLWAGPITVSTLPCPGEDCTDPFPIALTATCNTFSEPGFAGAGASAATSTGCWADGLATAARWYEFTAPANGIVDIVSLSTDTRVSFYDGGCAALNCLANDDDGGVGTQSSITPTAVTAGTTYLIEWDDRWSSAAFDFQIQFVQDAAPVVGAPTQTDVDVTYDAACANFLYEYGPVGFAPGTGTQGTGAAGTFNVSGLTAATTYDICFFCDVFGEGYPPVACDLTGTTIAQTTVPTCTTFTTSAGCPTPSATVANGAADEDIDVSMTSNGGGGLFDIEIGLPGFTPGTGTEVTSLYGSFNTMETFGIAEGLACGTTYDVYVRDNCPGPPAEVSLWFPDPVAGPAMTISTIACPGEGCTNPATLDGYCATAEGLTITANGSAITTTGPNALWWQFDAVADGTVVVSSCDYGTDTELAWHDLGVTPGDCAAPVTSTEFDDSGCGVGTTFASTTTQNVVCGNTYAVEWGDQWSTTLDFTFSFVCADGDVTALAGAATGETTADITFTAPTPTGACTVSTDVLVEYGPAGFAPGTGTLVNAATSPLNVTGLMSCTTYDVYSVYDCQGLGVMPSDVSCLQMTTITTDCPCGNPTTLACSEGVVNGDATFSWANGGGDGSYDVEWGTAGFVPGTGTELGSILGTTNTSEDATGLTCGDTVDFWVRDNCAALGASSTWIGPCTVNLLCPPPPPAGVDCSGAPGTVPNVVYTDDFETDAGWTGALGTGTTTSNFNFISGPTGSVGTGPLGAHSGATYIYYEASAGTAGNVACILSPPINLAAATADAELSFWIHMWDNGTGNMSDLTTSVTTDGGATFTTVSTILGAQQLAQTDPYFQVGANLSAYLGQTIQIQFCATQGASFEGDIAIDLLEITSCAGCATPSVTLTEVNACDPNNEFFIDVTTDLGSGTSVDIVDDQGNGPVTVTVAGTTTQFGPYPSGTTVTFTSTPDNDDGNCVSTDVVTYNCPTICDQCTGAIVIPVEADACQTITTCDNIFATDSNLDDLDGDGVADIPAATCTSYGGGDIWFTLTVPASGNVNISGAASPNCCSFLWYEVYTGADCLGLTNLTCSVTNGNDPSNFETILTGLTPGDQLWIRAWDSLNDNGPGDFNMCAYEPQPIVEQTCSDGPFSYCYPNSLTDFEFAIVCPDTAGDIASVTFCSGELEAGFDSMSIFSAPSGTTDANVSGTPVATAVDGDQSGITYTAGAADECLYFYVSSDASVSCGDAGITSSLEFQCGACPSCAATTSTVTYAPQICSGDVFDINFTTCQVNATQDGFALVFDTDPTTVPADPYAEWANVVNGTSVDWVFLGNTANCGDGGFSGLAFLNTGCDPLSLTPYLIPIDVATNGVDVNCPVEVLPDFDLLADPLAPIISNNGDCTYTITGNCPNDVLTITGGAGANATVTGDGTNAITYAPGAGDTQVNLTIDASNGVPACPLFNATATIPGVPVPVITCPTTPLAPTDAPIDITATPLAGDFGSFDFNVVTDEFSATETSLDILDATGAIVATFPVGSFPNLITGTLNSGPLPLSGAPYTINLNDTFGDGWAALACAVGTVDGTIEILDAGSATQLLPPTLVVGDGTCGGVAPSVETYGPFTPTLQFSTTGVFAGPGTNVDDATDIGGSAGIANDGQTTFDPAAAGPGIHTISYTFTDVNGCPGTATCDIEVTGSCTVNAGSDATVDLCSADAALDITPADGDAGGAFSPALASGTGTFDPAVDAAGVYTYTVTDPADPTCTDSADITVNVTQAPVCNTDCTLGDLEIFDPATCSCVVDVVTVLGCTDPAFCEYDPAANCDDMSCATSTTDPGTCSDGDCTNGLETWDATTCSCVSNPPSGINGCTDPAFCEYDPNADCDDGSCMTPNTDPGTCNTDCTVGDTEVWDSATCACVVDVVSVDGCTDMTACNYDPNATCDDGTCVLPDGCTDPAFCEYDPNAVCDDGSCVTSNADPGTCNTDCTVGDTEVWDANTCACVVDVVTVSGCTDPTAANYDPNANCDDGSCLSITFQVDGGNTGGPFTSDDPCACNNDESAPNAGDGTFSELVLVTGPPGLNVIASGMSSGLIGVTLPAPFVETSPGNYELVFNHLNLVGFTVTVGYEDPANPGTFIPALDANGVQVVQSNVCAYPVLTSTLPSSICNNAGMQDLDLLITEDNGDPPGTTSYTVDGAASGNMFDPSAYPVGSTVTIVATYSSVDDGNGGSSPDGVEPAHPGMCDQTFTASLTIQDCASCPTTSTADCPEELCDGDMPTMFTVVVDDPLGTAVSSGWFADAAGTTPVTAVGNQGCASSSGATYFVVSCDSDADGVGDTQVLLLTHNFDIYPADFTATVSNTTDCTAPSVSIAAADGTECATTSGTAAAAPVCPATSNSETSAYNFNFFDGTSCEQNFSGIMTSDCSGTCPCPMVIGSATSEDVCGSSAATVPGDATIIDDPALGTVTWSPDPAAVVASGCAPYTVVYTSTITCTNDCSVTMAGPTHTLNVWPDPADFQGAVTVAGTCGTEPSIDLSGVTCLPDITGPTATTATVDGCDTNADTSDDPSDGAYDFTLAQPASTVCPAGAAYSETLSTTDTACTDVCPGVVDFCELVIACVEVSECDGTSGMGVYDITVTVVYNVTSGNSIDVSVDGGASSQSLTPALGALTTATMTFTGLTADAASHTVDAAVSDPTGICTASAGQASFTAPADCAACAVPNAGTVTGP